MALGEQLKNGRLALKQTASEVAAATRMKVQIVEAIEQEDFDKIPATIYAKGFIKLYAEHLRLDPKPLIDEYIFRYVEPKKRSIAEPPPEPPKKSFFDRFISPEPEAEPESSPEKELIPDSEPLPELEPMTGSQKDIVAEVEAELAKTSRIDLEVKPEPEVEPEPVITFEHEEVSVEKEETPVEIPKEFKLEPLMEDEPEKPEISSKAGDEGPVKSTDRVYRDGDLFQSASEVQQIQPENLVEPEDKETVGIGDRVIEMKDTVIAFFVELYAKAKWSFSERKGEISKKWNERQGQAASLPAGKGLFSGFPLKILPVLLIVVIILICVISGLSRFFGKSDPEVVPIKKDVPEYLRVAENPPAPYIE